MVEAMQAKLEAATQQRLPVASVTATSPSSQGSERLTTYRLQQPLYAGGRINANIDLAAAELADARLQLLLDQRQLLSKAVQLLVEWARQSDKLDVAQKNRNSHQALVGNITRRVQAEINPLADLTLARSRLLTADVDFQTAHQQRAKVKQKIEEFFGTQFFGFDVAASSYDLARRTDWASISMDHSLELRRVQLQQQMFDIEAQQRRSEFLPNLSLRHEKRSGYTVWTNNFAPQQTTLEMTLSLGPGTSQLDQLRAAELKKQATQQQQISFEREQRERTLGLVADWAIYQGQAVAARENLALADSVAQSYERQFVVGRKTWQDVLNAQREAAQLGQNAVDLRWTERLTAMQIKLEAGLLHELCPHQCIAE
jgi:adhesin transport system outer membrane protein